MVRTLLVLILLCIGLPSSVWAAGAFDVSATDASMQYLGNVFGAMGTLPVGADGSPLFADMIQIMNKIIFFLGLIIVVYTGAVSTIQTAQEGEVLGKKWSTIWVPVRAAFGLFLMLPSPGSGYSYIQIGVMYLIIQGVGAANAIWERVIYHLATGQSIVSPTESPYQAAQSQQEIVKQFIKSELCTYIVNTTPELSDRFEGEPILFFQKEGQPNMLIWGTESNQSPVCGSIKVPDLSSARPAAFGTAEYSLDPLIRIHRNMMFQISFAIAPIAEETQIESDPNNWTTPANLPLITRTLKGGYLDIHNYYNSVRNDPTNVLDFAKIQGWIHAGNYYSRLVKQQAQGAQAGSYPPEGYRPPLYVNITQDEIGATRLENKIDASITQIYNQALELLNVNITRPNVLQSSGLGGGSSGDLAPLTDALKNLSLTIIASMSGGTGYRDPLVPITNTGLEIMRVIEITFWVILATIPIVAVASIPPCINPIWGVVATIALFAASIFMIVAPVVWTAGVLLGLYVPLIPFLVYTFSAIAWIILVIEAIVAAPLIALVLVVPSEDDIGKAGHSLVILLGLIFRPALMVVGFILGAKVMFVSVGMIDYGFREFIMTNLTGIGVFGSVALIVLYCGVVITIIHQSFSLIYNIPDKVLRWMGGQPETQDVSSKVQQIRGSADKAGQTTGGVMKGAAGGVQAAKNVGG